MLDAVSILRQREGFKGYIHLKMMPGVPPGHIEWAAGLVDRLSINLEAPTPEYLARIAPKKSVATNAVAAMETVRLIENRLPHLLKAGQTTQARRWRCRRVGPRDTRPLALVVRSHEDAPRLLQRLSAGVRRRVWRRLPLQPASIACINPTGFCAAIRSRSTSFYSTTSATCRSPPTRSWCGRCGIRRTSRKR